ncbi:hypothetical protein FKR81_16410 [Lentzea tibetensis]|uniref:Thioredoxin domain-containing protein n=1 Tax=Lentzea tibetensis TaxID=2591470 RepID=A0A563EU49_9PSEU|nr:hypothetical protein [Lentzea tibetensis]TWP51200.1 hypothetical protein FKR81_16410 [Lentzea tibetensis]
MNYVIAACALLGALVLLNLALTFGVIRRLREHEEKLAGGGQVVRPRLVIETGESAGDFSSTDVDGITLARKDLGPGLVSFFTPSCTACEERLPVFVREAAREPRERVVVVVVGGESETADLVRQLTPVARVFVEAVNGPLSKAFQVTGFPAAVRVDGNGVVVESDQELALALAS